MRLGRGYIFRAADGTATKRRLISKARIGTTDIAGGPQWSGSSGGSGGAASS